MVGVEGCKERHSHAAGVERAVAVEQPLLVGSADDGAEAEVFVFLSSGNYIGSGQVFTGGEYGAQST